METAMNYLPFCLSGGSAALGRERLLPSSPRFEVVLCCSVGSFLSSCCKSTTSKTEKASKNRKYIRQDTCLQIKTIPLPLLAQGNMLTKLVVVRYQDSRRHHRSTR